MPVKNPRHTSLHPRLEVDGKFFRAGGERVFLKVVTYGPFPDPQPDHGYELTRVREAGFNAIRLYGDPDLDVLDHAAAAGLWVIVGPSWEWGSDFISVPAHFSAAQVGLRDGLKTWGEHPAVAMVLVANEIPVDMVRWMGVLNVKCAIESLIDVGRAQCPDLLFAYANFPTTEFLEPNNADVTAMNVYLEVKEDFASYLPRLHHVAGDRPVWISEFGLDSRSTSKISQREALVWQVEECLLAGMAGTTIYAWSDRWLNGLRVMDEWDFGITDRDGKSKPALPAITKVLTEIDGPEDGLTLERWPMISVVVCTHNGGGRMRACLSALGELNYPHYEVIVVDDGSTDDTAEIVGLFKGVKYIAIAHAGLSAARNRGADEALGEIVAYTDDDCQPDAAWLTWLAAAFESKNWDACGGPNLPPLPRNPDEPERQRWEDEAVVASAPGAPTHVMLNDLEAEHLPGCNLVVRKDVLQRLGGFDVAYRVAGDDVDFCWRLRAAGYRMGFAGGAFVWHRRRTTLWRYFKQQYAYGKAEALLMKDHPEKFRRGGGARWMGRVYGGGAMCVDAGSVIYHGPMATAPYQQVYLSMQPQRPLPYGFQQGNAPRKLALTKGLQPLIRSYSRWKHSLAWRKQVKKATGPSEFALVDPVASYDDVEARWWAVVDLSREMLLEELRKDGWMVAGRELQSQSTQDVKNESDHADDDNEALVDYGNSDWDLERAGMRLLIACERHHDGTVLLTRIEMNSRKKGQLPKEIEQLMHRLHLKRV